MSQTDQRRKLNLLDYSKIRVYNDASFNIRELASEFGVSTKYVKKLLGATVIFNEDGTTRWLMAADSNTVAPQIERLPCSGCGMGFNDRSGLMLHWEIWTSGNTKELDCATVMPMVVR